VALINAHEYKDIIYFDECDIDLFFFSISLNPPSNINSKDRKVNHPVQVDHSSSFFFNDGLLMVGHGATVDNR
jgi:hypothetical protein